MSDILIYETEDNQVEVRLEQNASELQQALELVRKAARLPELDTDAGRGLVEIISRYNDGNTQRDPHV